MAAGGVVLDTIASKVYAETMAGDPLPDEDLRIAEFLAHLTDEKGASVYTLRNYRQALTEFRSWFAGQFGDAPDWPLLGRDNFRAYLRFPPAWKILGKQFLVVGEKQGGEK